MNKNHNLHKAKKEANNEFYTQLEDIEKELQHYTEHLKGKVIYCNCDDPSSSNFIKYFKDNFDKLELKGLLYSHYNMETGEGSFDSEASIELLKEADIVITNPPFSLFRKYVKMLVDYGKDFLVIGNMNAITYKDVFKLIKDGKVRQGVTFPRLYEIPYVPTQLNAVKLPNGNHLVNLPNTVWFTTLKSSLSVKKLILYKKYTPEEYPKYDNYDVINVDKVRDIPVDYDGVMGIPISFLGKWNPEQFDIIGCSSNHGRPDDWDSTINMSPSVNGKNVYQRLLIKLK